MNQRAYISASLRFLASTIISCNSTDTSSERIRETERTGGEREKKRRMREGIKWKTEEIIRGHSKTQIDRNRDYSTSTGGSATQADKSFCNQRFSTVRGNLLYQQINFCTCNHDVISAYSSIRMEIPPQIDGNYRKERWTHNFQCPFDFMTMITLRVANISFNYVHHLFHKVITSINANCTTLVLLHT